MLQDASKFMRHSKRHTLTTEDINSALVANLKEVCPAQATHLDWFSFSDVEIGQGNEGQYR